MKSSNSNGIARMKVLSAAGLMVLVSATSAAPARSASAPAEAASPANQQGWAVSCAAAGRAGVLNCAAEQKVIAQETGQAISGVSVRVPGDSRKPAIVFLFPFGLYILPAYEVVIC